MNSTRSPFEPDPRCLAVDGFHPTRLQLKAMAFNDAAPFMGVGASKRCASQDAAKELARQLFRLGRWAKLSPMKSGGVKVTVTFEFRLESRDRKRKGKHDPLRDTVIPPERSSRLVRIPRVKAPAP